jgi:alpha-tubulin suppressor-like RCC1 family protein
VKKPLQFPGWKTGDEVWLAITLWSGGKIKFDELGFSSAKSAVNTLQQMHPVHVENGTVVAASAGNAHACLLLESGDIMTFGRNESGQCGVRPAKDDVAAVDEEREGGAAPAAAPPEVAGKVDEGAAKQEPRKGNAAEKKDGEEEEEEWVLQPTLVEVVADPSPHFVKVACGGMHTLALDQSGRVWSCGANGSGQLGRSTPAGTHDWRLALVDILPHGIVVVDIIAVSCRAVFLYP